MKAELGVKKVYPKATARYSQMHYWAIFKSPYSRVELTDRTYSSFYHKSWAWANALRNIKASRQKGRGSDGRH